MNDSQVSKKAPRIPRVVCGKRTMSLPNTSLENFSTLGCALAVAMVPVFSYVDQLSYVPQVASIAAIVLAGPSMLRRVPALNIGFLCFCLLTFQFGMGTIYQPELWPGYQTMLKVCVLALAVHLVIRTSKQLLIMFGAYAASAPLTLWLNSGAIHSARLDVLSGGTERFAGTLANANTAGIYGLMAILSAMIFFGGWNTRMRWPVLLAAASSGFAIAYFSGSRKAMIGLPLLCVVAPWVTAQNPAKAPRIFSWKAATLFLSSGVVGTLLLFSLPQHERLLTLFREGLESESSSRKRLQMLETSLTLWADRPFLGHGYDGFARFSEFDSYSHTTFGEILCNGGIVGLGLLGAFYLIPLYQIIALWRRSQIPKSLAAGLIAFCALLGVLSWSAVLISSRDYIPMYAAVCGYVQNLISSSRGRQREFEKRLSKP